jgi:hypothetical protein
MLIKSLINMPHIETHLDQYEDYQRPILIKRYDYHLSINNGVHLSWIRDGQIIPITYRPIEKYEKYRIIPFDFLSNPNIKSLQIAESGPGLSEMLPYIASVSDHPPIAIDPLQYELVYDMLSESLAESLTPENKATIHTLIRRAEWYLSPKIRLYNIGIEQVESFPELRNTADVVIDCAGGFEYTHDAQKSIHVIHNYLLKQQPKGRYFHSY